MSDSDKINEDLSNVDSSGYCSENSSVFYFFNSFWIKFVQTLKYLLKTIIVLILIGLLTYGTSRYTKTKNTNIFVFVAVLLVISLVISALGAYDKNLYYAILIGVCIGLGKDVIKLFDIFKKTGSQGTLSNPISE